LHRSSLQNARPAPRRRSGAAPLPRQLAPPLATLVDRVPQGTDWLHEIKYDGYRVLARLERGRARLWSRNGRELTTRMAALARALEALPGLDDAWLDGEVVALQADGRTSFPALQAALAAGRDRDLVYYLFDLPYADGEDLTREPLLARKRRLAALLPAVAGPDARLRYSEHLRGDGAGFYAHACRFGLEGVVSKRCDAGYRGGRRRDWVKIKCRRRQEFLVCGFTAPRGARAFLGALVLGVYDERGLLRYVGRTGTGFDAASLRTLRERLERLRTAEPPFAHALARELRRGVTWVRPETVIEAAFAGWTREGLVRQAVFQGVREDKAPREVVREVAQPLAGPETESPTRAVRAPRAVRLTHPERVLYPEQGLTKADLAGYYARVAPWMLPWVAGRPLTLVRCPEGRERSCFFQRHAGRGAPEALVRVPLAEPRGAVRTYLALDSVDGLLALAQMGVLEIHVWNARIDRPEAPDQLVFDLDPGPSVPWSALVEAAQHVRRRLAELGLAGFVRTTGGKGLHVVTPLVRRHDWHEVKAFARAFAGELARAEPRRYTASAARAGREARIYIDYLRNARGASAIAAYSPRARAGAPVAVPLAWDELAGMPRPARLDVTTVPARLEGLLHDPWSGFERARRALSAPMKRPKASPAASGAMPPNSPLSMRNTYATVQPPMTL